MVNPCLILSYNSLDEIVRQEIPKNILVLFWSWVKIHSTHLAETFDILKMSVRIDCTAPKRMPT